MNEYKTLYPQKLNQSREIVFDKLDFFGIKYTSEQKLITVFDFQLIRVVAETFKDRNKTTWIRTMSPYLYPFLQTLWKNQFPSGNLIFIISLHLLLEVLIIYLPKSGIFVCLHFGNKNPPLSSNGCRRIN